MAIATGQEFLGKTIEVIFDRPLGSIHPKYDDMIYPVNYGYVPGTKAGDGDEIDVYYLTGDKPLEKVTAKCIGYVRRLDDNDDKLIATAGELYTVEEIEKKLEFQEKWFKHEIILESKRKD
ncbi:inorganic diphosphatase [bacterium]|nr:inorganic diphosphatase [bacterium]